MCISVKVYLESLQWIMWKLDAEASLYNQYCFGQLVAKEYILKLNIK